MENIWKTKQHGKINYEISVKGQSFMGSSKFQRYSISRYDSLVEVVLSVIFETALIFLEKVELFRQLHSAKQRADH